MTTTPNALKLAAELPDFLTNTDVARIRRSVYGGTGFDSTERLFAAEIECAVRKQFTALLEQQHAALESLREELRITDQLLEQRNKLLAAIPACEAHGDQCIPHAIEWVQRQVEPLRAARVPDGLAAIGELIRTQDNRYTADPIFVVEQKRTYVGSEGYGESRLEWVDEDGNVADDKVAGHLEANYRKSFEEPKKWRRLFVFDVWEFVTACFTEQGCKDYLARDGHNLKEPRIYAYGSYRNHEYQAIRKALASTTTPPQPEKADPCGFIYRKKGEHSEWSYCSDPARYHAQGFLLDYEAYFVSHTNQAQPEQAGAGDEVREALQAGKHYAEEALARHDEAYGRHPATEPERNAITGDIAIIDAALTAQEQKGAV